MTRSPLKEATTWVRKGRRSLIVLAVAGVVAALAAGALLWDTGDQGGSSSGTTESTTDTGAGHVHGLGVNPNDGSLFIATHYGLFRADRKEQQPARVGERFQDTMGFTVAGPDRFLGSGHPDLEEAREQNLPPHLGLIESTDAGVTWQPISLQGEADFHVLRLAGERLYGYDASNDRLMASADRGRTWEERERPGPLIDLAAAPGGPERLVAATAEGLFESRDGGRSWRSLGRAPSLVAWPSPQRLYLVAADGRVYSSADGGRRVRVRGDIGGQPAALVADGPDELYVALHDGLIKRSTDGGATWEVRAALAGTR